MHLDGVSVDQPGKGKNVARSRDYLPAARLLLQTMDEYRVGKAIIMPPPQGSGQHGTYGYEDLLPVVEAHPDRIAFAGGGGSLNPMINGTQPEDVTDGVRATFRKKALQIIEAGASAFGEMTAMHFCMDPKHHYVASPPDHPLFLLLADIAAEHGLPIDLHMEAIHSEITVPARLREACSKNPVTAPSTVPAFERLLSHNADAKIVWQHIGWDNTGQMTPELLRRLLKTHGNLFLAFKAVPQKPGGPARRNAIGDSDGNVGHQWLDLLREFEDRIVVGADEFINAGSGYRKPPFFKQTWRLIDRLPDDLRRKIGRENAWQIYNLQ